MGPVQSAIYWLLDEDNSLLRVTVGTADDVPEEKIFVELDGIVASMERL